MVIIFKYCVNSVTFIFLSSCYSGNTTTKYFILLSQVLWEILFLDILINRQLYCRRLVALLSVPSSLITLILRNTCLGAKGVSMILEGIMKTYLLQELDLSENEIEPCIPSFIPMLRDHPSLQSLTLTGCSVSLASATKLGEAVAQVCNHIPFNNSDD
jgi:hypothetical protein